MPTSLVLIFWALLFAFTSESDARTSLSHQRPKWDLSDVSVLLPLPEEIGRDPLLRPDSVGSAGSLIAQDVFNAIPPLSFPSENQELRTSMRALGVRIDPCFPGSSLAPEKCRAQIRIVWQPLVLDIQNHVTTLDVALHSFYELTQDEFRQLTSELQKLKNDFPITEIGSSLGIHPILKRDGLQSPFLTRFQALILRWTGEKRMTRITFMQLAGGGSTWLFGGFDRTETGISRMNIARTGSLIQAFFNSASPADHFAFSDLRPTPSGSDTLNLLVLESSQIRPEEDQAQIIESVAAANRIENPDFHSPETMDCVSCHVAQPARLWAIRTFPWMKLESIGAPFAYKSEFNLMNQSPPRENTKNLRAFGYFENEVAISQRTINESAAVAKYLNTVP